MREPSEFDIQRALVIWLEGNPDALGNARTTPALRPGVEFWHTPNGGSRRDAFEGKRLKDMGAKAGIHDLLFLADGQLYGLELKAPGGKASRAQTDMHVAMMAAGMAASAIIDNLAGAKVWLFRQGLTVF